MHLPVGWCAVAMAGFLSATPPWAQPTPAPASLRFVLRTLSTDAKSALAAQDQALATAGAALRQAGVSAPPTRLRLSVTRLPLTLDRAAGEQQIVVIGRYAVTMTSQRDLVPAIAAVLGAGAMWADVAVRAPRFEERSSWALAPLAEPQLSA